jgi:hypothetical protein
MAMQNFENIGALSSTPYNAKIKGKLALDFPAI